MNSYDQALTELLGKIKSKTGNIYLRDLNPDQQLMF